MYRFAFATTLITLTSIWPATLRAVQASLIAISYTVCQGKPGGACETISVQIDGSKAFVQIDRAVPGEMNRQLKEARIPDRPASDFIAFLETQHLSSFVPEEQTGQVTDFGVRTLRVVTHIPSAGQSSEYSVSWRRPLSNEMAIDLLADRLGLIAHLYLPDIPLAYFPFNAPRRP